MHGFVFTGEPEAHVEHASVLPSRRGRANSAGKTFLAKARRRAVVMPRRAPAASAAAALRGAAPAIYRRPAERLRSRVLADGWRHVGFDFQTSLRRRRRRRPSHLRFSRRGPSPCVCWASMRRPISPRNAAAEADEPGKRAGRRRPNSMPLAPSAAACGTWRGAAARKYLSREKAPRSRLGDQAFSPWDFKLADGRVRRQPAAAPPKSTRIGEMRPVMVTAGEQPAWRQERENGGFAGGERRDFHGCRESVGFTPHRRYGDRCAARGRRHRVSTRASGVKPTSLWRKPSALAAVAVIARRRRISAVAGSRMHLA